MKKQIRNYDNILKEFDNRKLILVRDMQLYSEEISNHIEPKTILF